MVWLRRGIEGVLTRRRIGLPEADHWRTFDNEIGAVPGVLQCKEPQFVWHPLVPEPDDLILVTVAALIDVTGDAAPLGLGEV